MKASKQFNEELNFRSVAQLLSRRERRVLLGLSVFRVLANGLDILGISGIALLASAFGSFASNSNGPAVVQIPGVGEIFIFQEEAVLLALLVTTTFVVKSVLSIFLNLKTSLYVASIESGLSTRLAQKFFSVANRDTSKSTVSEFQNTAISSTVGIRNFLNARILFMAEGSLLISLLAVFLVVNPAATLSLAAFLGCVLFIMNRVVNRKLKSYGQQVMRGTQESLETTRDLFGIMREAQAAGAIDGWTAKFTQGRSDMANASAKTYVLNGLPRFIIETSLIVAIFLFLGAVVIFSDLATQATTVGVFLAGGLRIIASLIPFQGSISAMKTGASTGHFAYKVLQETKTKPNHEENLDSPHRPGGESLIFEDVSFSYDSETATALSDISFRVEPHTKVAIVGPSGAGKSTIMDLAMGFLICDGGQVVFQGAPTREVLTKRPGTFGLVPQRPHLISGTLVENVSLLPAKDTDSLRVKKLLTQVGLGNYTDWRYWEETRVTPDSGQFSGGEIQRISLARALYTGPQVLFLDEATSALDAETENLVTGVINQLAKEITVVLIAHRLSTVKSADKIIYIDSGRLVAEGSFEELKAQVPGFKRAVSLMEL